MLVTFATYVRGLYAFFLSQDAHDIALITDDDPEKGAVSRESVQ
jgi:hypothetical protein